ncbi:hypothetical protein JOQ06_014889, partial [Pogonophryne albipinna]
SDNKAQPPPPCTVKPLNCVQWTIVSCGESGDITLCELTMSSTGHRLPGAPGA